VFARQGNTIYIAVIQKNLLSAIPYAGVPTAEKLYKISDSTVHRVAAAAAGAAAGPAAGPAAGAGGGVPPAASMSFYEAEENAAGTLVPGEQVNGHAFRVDLILAKDAKTQKYVFSLPKGTEYFPTNPKLKADFVADLCMSLLVGDNNFLSLRQASLSMQFDVEAIHKTCTEISRRICKMKDDEKIDEKTCTHAVRCLGTYRGLIKNCPHLFLGVVNGIEAGFFVDSIENKKIVKNFRNAISDAASCASAWLNGYVGANSGGSGLLQVDVKGIEKAFRTELFVPRVSKVLPIVENFVVLKGLEGHGGSEILVDCENVQAIAERLVVHETSIAMLEEGSEESGEETNASREEKFRQNAMTLTSHVGNAVVKSEDIADVYNEAITSEDIAALFKTTCFFLTINSYKLNMKKAVTHADGHTKTADGVDHFVQIVRSVTLEKRVTTLPTDLDADKVTRVSKEEVVKAFPDAPHWPVFNAANGYAIWKNNLCFMDVSQTDIRIKSLLQQGFGFVIGMYFISDKKQWGVGGQTVLLRETVEAISKARPHPNDKNYTTTLNNIQSNIQAEKDVFISSRQILCGMIHSGAGRTWWAQ